MAKMFSGGNSLLALANYTLTICSLDMADN